MEYLDTWSKKRTIGKLSLLDQLRLASTPNTLIGGRDPSAMAKFPDFSHWNGKVDVKAMAPYIHAVMAKCSDGKQVIAGGVNDLNTYKDDIFDDTVQKAYDNGLPLIAYHYWQPDHQPAAKAEDDRQFMALKNAMSVKPGKSVHGIRIDLEEKATVWHGEVKNRLQTFYAWCLKEWGSLIPIDFYTSTGYLESVPAVRDWMALSTDVKTVHYAQWAFTARTRVTWAQLYAKIQSADVKVLNYAGWRAVQISAAFYGMEGCGDGETDFNLFNGTPEALRAYHNYKQVVTPPTPPTPDPDPEPTTDPALVARVTALEAQVTALTKFVNGHTHVVPVGITTTPV